MYEVILLGIVAGLAGFFYRNILKGEEMIFNPIYKVLKKWHDEGNAFQKFITFPLGYCIYCNTTWVSVLMYVLWYLEDIIHLFTHTTAYMDIAILVVDLLVVIGVSHLVVVVLCKYLIPDSDFDISTPDPVSTIAKYGKLGPRVAFSEIAGIFTNIPSHSDEGKRVQAYNINEMYPILISSTCDSIRTPLQDLETDGWNVWYYEDNRKIYLDTNLLIITNPYYGKSNSLKRAGI